MFYCFRSNTIFFKYRQIARLIYKVVYHIMAKVRVSRNKMRLKKSFFCLYESQLIYYLLCTLCRMLFRKLGQRPNIIKLESFKRKGNLYFIPGNLKKVKRHLNCILREEAPKNECTFCPYKCLTCYIVVKMFLSPSVFHSFDLNIGWLANLIAYNPFRIFHIFLSFTISIDLPSLFYFYILFSLNLFYVVLLSTKGF